MKSATLRALVVFVALLGSPAFAGPPIGKRRYVIDQTSPFAPVKIEAQGSPVAGTYLKDPIQVFMNSSMAGPKPAPKPKRILSSRVRSKQLRFNKLPVGGFANKPRVNFSRDTLSIERADEPVSQDFFDKVFLPSQDRSY